MTLALVLHVDGPYEGKFNIYTGVWGQGRCRQLWIAATSAQHEAGSSKAPVELMPQVL